MYVNYGNEIFFKYGFLVESDSINTSVIDIIYCVPMSEPNDNYYFFAYCEVDIDSDRIEKDFIMRCIGMTDANFNKIEFAKACIEFYDVEYFSDICYWLCTKQEVKAYLSTNSILFDEFDNLVNVRNLIKKER